MASQILITSPKPKTLKEQNKIIDSLNIKLYASYQTASTILKPLFSLSQLYSGKKLLKSTHGLFLISKKKNHFTLNYLSKLQQNYKHQISEL